MLCALGDQRRNADFIEAGITVGRISLLFGIQKPAEAYSAAIDFVSEVT
jgi:hypothetical protein